MLHLIYFHVCASMCETTENIPPRLSRQKVPCHPPTGTVHQDECGWGGVATFEKSQLCTCFKKVGKILT
jgi:hypothetical protein